MSGLLHAASRAGLSAAGNLALATVAGGIALCGAGLTALYLIDNIRETPAVTEMLCLVGVERPGCPDRAEEEARLRRQFAELQARTQAAEAELRSLRAVDDVRSVTFFQDYEAPDSQLTVKVGTVYSHLIGNPPPEYHFCYIELPRGAAGESRHLAFHTQSGPATISAETLRAAGVSQATLEFARSVCRPLLIGRE